MATHGQQPLHD